MCITIYANIYTIHCVTKIKINEPYVVEMVQIDYEILAYMDTHIKIFSKNRVFRIQIC